MRVVEVKAIESVCQELLIVWDDVGEEVEKVLSEREAILEKGFVLPEFEAEWGRRKKRKKMEMRSRWFWVKWLGMTLVVVI
jgi:hypothetical protein